MELTKIQKDCIHALAWADVRSDKEMLALILAEGIKFFFLDNGPISDIVTSEGNFSTVNEMVVAIENEIRINLN
jgi:hypothetical protein